MLKFLTVLLISLTFLEHVSGHGKMITPTSRSTVWRYYDGYPINWTDNELYCGGLTFMTNQGGKCGLCGDKYTDPIPRPNENTGTYGQGKITGTYSSGQVIDVTISLNANHMGTFVYSLCVLPDPNQPEPNEDCFQTLQYEDGSTIFNVPGSTFSFLNRIRLPEGLTCERCVLRWHYVGGNNWGTCEDGSYALGCGPQETFRNCADIQIM